MPSMPINPARVSFLAECTQCSTSAWSTPLNSVFPASLSILHAFWYSCPCASPTMKQLFLMWQCMSIPGVIRSNQESLAGHRLPRERTAFASQSPSRHADFAIRAARKAPLLIARNIKVCRRAALSASKPLSAHGKTLLCFPRSTFERVDEGLYPHTQTHTHVWTFLANISESLKPWAAATLLSPGNFYHLCLWCQSKTMLPILSKTDYYCPCTWEPQVQTRHQRDHILGHQEVKIEVFCLMSSQFNLL